MSTRIFLSIILVVGLFSSVSFGADYPGGSPTVPASVNVSGAGNNYLTTPVSSLQDGLIERPVNPYGLEGNAVVTGNISGGRHFRGIIPYQSTSETFGTSSDAVFSTIESFTRFASGDPYYNTSSGGYQAFHYPAQTVTSLQRNGQSGLAPPQMTFRGGTGAFAIRAPVQPQIPGRPFERGTDSLETLIELELARLKQQQADAEAAKEERLPGVDDAYENLLNDPLALLGLEKPETVLSLKEQLEAQMKRNEEQDQESKKEPIEELLEPIESEEKEEEKQEDPEKDKQSDPSEFKMPKISHAEAQAIRGEHKTYESYARAKYAEYMQAAEDFMKNGKYYRAADAYTLAGVAKRNDPTALLGRSHALFAAGEYMSSAYYLERAIALAPDYATGKLNLRSIFRDRDMFEDRLSKIMQWLRRSKGTAPELSFLLAYIFYQDDNPAMAQQMIEIAEKKMSDSVAVKILKELITKSSEIGEY